MNIFFIFHECIHGRSVCTYNLKFIIFLYFSPHEALAKKIKIGHVTMTIPL